MKITKVVFKQLLWGEIAVKALARRVRKFLSGFAVQVRWSPVSSARKTSRVVEAVVDLEKHYVFLLNPKVGSRSIISVLARYRSAKCIYLDKGLALKLQKQGVSFLAFWRDPCERIESCYNQKFNSNDPRILATHKSLGVSNDMTFSEFVAFLASDAGSDHSADKHWASQYVTLSLESVLDISSMRLFKFDDFEVEFREFVFSTYGDRVEIPRLLKTISKNQVTKDLKGLLEKRYQRDFEILEDI